MQDPGPPVLRTRASNQCLDDLLSAITSFSDVLHLTSTPINDQTVWGRAMEVNMSHFSPPTTNGAQVAVLKLTKVPRCIGLWRRGCATFRSSVASKRQICPTARRSSYCVRAI